MAWRVHLTNQTIQNVNILPGKQQLLVAWAQRDRATYFDLESGAVVGEHQHNAVSRQSERWSEFLAVLKAPNGAPLPLVRTAQVTIHTTSDGKLRLYQTPGGELALDMEGKEVRLEFKLKGDMLALALDRVMGVVVVLDRKGKLHIAQQNIVIGAFDLKLKLDSESQPSLAIGDGGSAIFVSDGQEILRLDAAGAIQKRLAIHYYVGRLACSPGGKHVVTSDPDTGVIRVYDGQLMPTHQKHAVDLIERAAQLQLMADLPPYSASPTTLVIDDEGRLAFSIAGVICTARLKEMDALPQTPRLL